MVVCIKASEKNNKSQEYKVEMIRMKMKYYYFKTHTQLLGA